MSASHTSDIDMNLLAFFGQNRGLCSIMLHRWIPESFNVMTVAEGGP